MPQVRFSYTILSLSGNIIPRLGKQIILYSYVQQNIILKRLSLSLLSFQYNLIRSISKFSWRLNCEMLQKSGIAETLKLLYSVNCSESYTFSWPCTSNLTIRQMRANILGQKKQSLSVVFLNFFQRKCPRMNFVFFGNVLFYIRICYLKYLNVMDTTYSRKCDVCSL
jgi:hypothetical protein